MARISATAASIAACLSFARFSELLMGILPIRLTGQYRSVVGTSKGRYSKAIMPSHINLPPVTSNSAWPMG